MVCFLIWVVYVDIVVDVVLWVGLDLIVDFFEFLGIVDCFLGFFEVVGLIVGNVGIGKFGNVGKLFFVFLFVGEVFFVIIDFYGGVLDEVVSC